VIERLGALTLNRASPQVQRPGYDFKRLRPGIVHLGVGAFSRAHLAVFTEDAILAAGGDWGSIGVALRRPDIPEALNAQDCLYTVETLSQAPQYRVVGAIRQALAATAQPGEVLAALAARETRVITLTITEKGYCLGADDKLDEAQPDIVHDLAESDCPRSAIGWLVHGFAERRKRESGPLTVISCDNLASNGRKLEAAALTFAVRWNTQGRGALSHWIERNVTFPRTVVDCIVPAATEESRRRVANALGMIDEACVSREPFAQWVIEDRFAGPRPAWDQAGAELVANVEGYERLKLHVLNACHSAVAYIGLQRGYALVREAICDPELSCFLELTIAGEIAPALTDLPVADYWRKIRARFANPMINHKLTQIGEDGSAKLAQRIFPLLVTNARAGRTCQRLASIVCAWLQLASHGIVKDPQAARLANWAAGGRDMEAALDDAMLFPAPFRTEPSVRAVLLDKAG